MDDRIEMIDHARRELGLSVEDLWWRYFAIGGMATALELDALVHGALVAGAADLDHLANAINDCYTERGGDHPLPYSFDG